MIFLIFVSSCYSQTKSLNDILLEITKQQNDFFVINECDEVSDDNLLYFANQKRLNFLGELHEKFPELSDIQRLDFFLIETYYAQSGSFYNYLIINDNIYTYHWKDDERVVQKIPIDEFKRNSLDNFVVIDLLNNKNDWINNLPEIGSRPVIDGGCFFVMHITWDTQKPNIKMALFKEYSSFK
jgi:hypothetical protein